MRNSFIITVLMVLLGLSNLYPQQQSITDYLAECERKYGSDADLVNGEKYFYPYRQSMGDPFFFTDSRSAVVTIHEKEFEGQQLRYDVFNQKLVLDYKDLYGATSSLVLRNEWVESFAFERHRFIKMQGPEGESGFFQLVIDGPIACVYRWSKSYQLNLTSGVQSYYFTEPVKESFLLIDGQFYPYRSNKTFLKAFDPEIQKPVKQFMRQSKVKVKKATDSQMRHLVEYCNSLSHEDS
ncbi:MAG: hypothetical protein K8R52_11855 [Bacteroidales bacterium]|nr:hypothetical protein [Bacteroidales bacterium]